METLPGRSQKTLTTETTSIALDRIEFYPDDWDDRVKNKKAAQVFENKCKWWVFWRVQRYATFLFHVDRRLAEKGDNARERALMMMMQGRLEANPEDELKKDLVPPDFMINKPQEEWSEDDQKAAKEFEKKKQQLQEDREKYRKSLETELKKLQSGISEATAVFDEKLGQLFQRKVKTEMVIYQVCGPA